MPTTLLAIDPGSRIVGFAVLQIESVSRPVLREAGCFRLRASTLAGRLLELQRDLSELIEDVSPTHAALESAYAASQHPQSALVMAHARGVILAALAQKALPITEITPATVKKSLTANGRATKEQVAAAVTDILKLPETPTPADMTDAIAIALAASQRMGVS